MHPPRGIVVRFRVQRRKEGQGERQYREMSARFTAMTGSIGIAGLHTCTVAMDRIAADLDRAAGMAVTDPHAVAVVLDRLVACSREIEQHLCCIRNSCARYSNAFLTGIFPAEGRGNGGTRALPAGREEEERIAPVPPCHVSPAGTATDWQAGGSP